MRFYIKKGNNYYSLNKFDYFKLLLDCSRGKPTFPTISYWAKSIKKLPKHFYCLDIAGLSEDRFNKELCYFVNRFGRGKW